MSRQLQLPPRCPISKANVPLCDHVSLIACKDENPRSRDQKYPSQSFMLEEQPAWLDDLLGDWDPDFKLKSHRRASSDSGTVLDGLVELPSLNTEKDDKSACSRDACTAATVLESAYMYGPNSPRSKENAPIQESAIVSALSEYASHGPVQYDNTDLFVSAFPQLDPVHDAADEINTEVKPFKRHSAQRSRVRKLQYIAELERSVESFQNSVSELAVRVESLVEQRVYLSLENKQLKQQLGRLQQQKFVMERQHQCMRNEPKGLKRRERTLYRSNSAGDSEKLRVEVEPSWHMAKQMHHTSLKLW